MTAIAIAWVITALPLVASVFFKQGINSHRAGPFTTDHYIMIPLILIGLGPIAYPVFCAERQV